MQFICSLSLLVTVIFFFSIENELKKVHGSLLYKIYFFTRILFICTSFVILGTSFIVDYFVLNFDNFNIEYDIKLSIKASFEFMPNSIKFITVITSLFAAIALLGITH